MAAQGPTDRRQCARCLAWEEGGATFCGVCGSSFSDAIAGADAEVYQELAQANLLRLRGDSRKAEEVCLSILRRFPGNVTAHSLLGDIHYERDDLRQAAEWYEMALDLQPDLSREREILARIRARQKELETRQTLEQIEVPKQSPVVIYVVGVAVLAVLMAGAGFVMGRGGGGGAARTEVTPLTIPAQEGVSERGAVGAGESDPGQVDPGAGGESVEAGGRVILDDEAVVAAMRAQGQRSAQVVGALVDPGREGVVVTARVLAGEEASVTAMLVASDAFVSRPQTREVTVRMVDAGRLVFVGTVGRDAFDEAQKATSSASVEELVALMFPNPWPSGAGGGSPVVEGEVGAGALPGVGGATGGFGEAPDPGVVGGDREGG